MQDFKYQLYHPSQNCEEEVSHMSHISVTPSASAEQILDAGIGTHQPADCLFTTWAPKSYVKFCRLTGASEVWPPQSVRTKKDASTNQNYQNRARAWGLCCAAEWDDKV